jgi:hypothetical protein
MASELDTARQWYEAFIEKTELAVYMEQPSPNQVDLSCGSGSLRISFSGEEFKVTCNTNAFMEAVATALQAWIIEQTKDTSEGISLTLVLSQFGCLSAQHADLLADAMDDRGSRSGSDADDYCYGENEVGGSQVLGINATTSSSSSFSSTSKWVEGHNMKKRWEQKELQLREERRLQHVEKERQSGLAQSKKRKSEDNDIPATGGSSSSSSMSVGMDMDIPQPRSAASTANMFSRAASSKVLMNDLLALMNSPADLGFSVGACCMSCIVCRAMPSYSSL